PVLHRRKFFQGRAIRGSEVKDLVWLEPSGKEMSDEAWNAGFVKCLGMRLDGGLIGDLDKRGEPIKGDTLLILLNAHHEDLSFQLPVGAGWERLFDTAEPDGAGERYEGERQYPLKARSLAVLKLATEPEA